MLKSTQNNARKGLLRALASETVQPAPLWLMRQAGRYLPEYREIRANVRDFLELCYTPDLAIEVTMQPVRRFHPDAAILFADILLVPHALGQDLAYREGEGPVLAAIRSAADVERLQRGRLHEVLAPVYETVTGLRAALPDDVALIGFAGAPWTVATYMVEGGSSRDFATAKTWAYRDPSGFQALIDVLIEATADYLIRQVESGAEALQIFDTWAGALPASAFERWCIAPTAEIVHRVKAVHGEVPVIGFPRGAGALYEGYAERTGVSAVSLDPTVAPAWAGEVLQGRWPVQGNLDPLLLVVGGAAMEAEVQAILGALAGGPFVFNLGHGIVPQTPPEHVAELVALVREGRS